MEPNENLLSSDIRVDEFSMLHLRETAKWARFLGIVGFIFSVLLALLGVFINYFFSMISRMNPAAVTATNTGVISVVYILAAVLYFFLSFYLYSFGAKMLTSLQANDQGIFNDSLLNLKRVYRIMGIITIIYLGIMVLAFLGVLMMVGLRR